VSGAGASDAAEGFRFRRLEKPEEFRQVDEVERAVGGGDANVPTLPVALLRALQDNGGLVVGAFADIYLAGFTASLIGWDGTSLYHYSQQLAVRPEYQNHHLGFRLMAFQRDEVLRLGLTQVRWAFDPLQSRAAWLTVHRLGARPDRYYSHYYGQLPDAPNSGLETDRVRAVWSVAAPEVEARMDGKYPSGEDDRKRWAASSAIVETEPGESGIRVPSAVGEPSGVSAHLEIPFDLALVRAHEPKSLRKWRHAVRDAFRAATDLGYVIDDFSVVSADHERRSFYFLRPAEASPPPSAAGSPR
jgi:chorismate synthase